MKKRTRIGLATLVVIGGCTAGAWQFVRPRDPLFRGIPESVWIEKLVYNDDEQVKQWREYGPNGVRALARAYDHANSPIDRFYRNAHQSVRRVFPSGLIAFLSYPKQDMTRGSRMNVVQLLAHLSKDENLATPSMVRALRDESPYVRQLAINYFNHSEDGKGLLDTMEAGAKRDLLPTFIDATQDKNSGIRNNAIVALRCYPEQAAIVVPALFQTLQDSDSRVRQVAAETLAGIAPDQINAEVVKIVIDILKDPDDQIAYRAAVLLGEMRREPELCVPALIEGAGSPNQTIATHSAQALGSFTNEADVILPVLLKIHQDHNSAVVKWASEGALKKLDPSFSKEQLK